MSEFSFKHNQSAKLKLSASVVRRYILHILPKGFMRIRHYGYLSNAVKTKSLSIIRKALSKP
ncbi:hypothetical protein BTE48_16005 [Oceanospirillum multiglobuliferum]|uniref:Transposase IS801/IS1294 domain-containing protein n=1 Tax=Oceanospirillum multiglobuliferum TaxID=64969 RepID=A0A1V4T1R2_9GAMM|nr:transposase [Oceanospirillum multiglobuliferum]OPX54098.1 hypothetical protein BTE48_16005 [Oceanospirillum multiglobuliferum]